MSLKPVFVSLVSIVMALTPLGYTGAGQSPQPTQNPPETIAAQNRKIIQAAIEKARIQTEGENGKPRLMVQLGHSDSLICAVFSPDGRLVLTGSADNTARLWEVETGKEVWRFEGHSRSVTSVAFSPDGRLVLTGSEDNTARLWEVSTGKEVRRLAGHSFGVNSVVFSSDGQKVLTGSDDKTAKLWNVATGTEIRKLEGHSSEVNTVAFSPDGRLALTGGNDKTARLWEVATGKEVRKLEEVSEVNAVAFSPNGKQALIGSGDDKTGSARLWEVDTGKEVRKLVGHSSQVVSVAFSPDGRLALTGSWDTTSRVWEVSTGKELIKIGEEKIQPEFISKRFRPVAFSPDGQMVLTMATNMGQAQLWEVGTGKEVRKLAGQSSAVNIMALSHDGRIVLTGNVDWQARLFEVEKGLLRRLEDHRYSFVMATAFSQDGRLVLTGGSKVNVEKTRMIGEARVSEVVTGKKVQSFEGHTDAVRSVAISPDGKLALTGSADKTARLWEVTTGKEIWCLEGHSDWVNSVAFSPDGQLLIIGSGQVARLWEVATGKEVRRFEGNSPAVFSVAFSPDGQLLLIGSGQEARLWDTTSGKELQKLEGNSRGVTAVAFSPNGQTAVTWSQDRTACLWNVQTGSLLQVFAGHFGAIGSVAFSPNGKIVFTANSDGTTRLWNSDTGEEICQLMFFYDGTWAVVDKDGRYDASNSGNVQEMHWVVRTNRGPESIALSQLKDRYYEPGLLAKIMGFNTEPLREVQAFQNVKLYPEIKCEAPCKNSTRTRITLTNQGGGIGKVVVKLNGKEVIADARGPKPDPNATQVTLPIDLYSPFLERGRPNKVQIFAYNAEGYLSSRGTEIIWTPDGTVDEAPPELYAIVAGISDYNGTQIDLKFAAKDADDVAKALELGASKLFNGDDTERVHITLLSTSSDNPKSIPPTKENFRQAFEAIKAKAKPQDVVVVYLAGHGVKLPNVEDTYCYLTRDARNTNLSDPDVVKLVTITSDELSEWMKLPAQKQVMILDTCAAGAAATKLIENRTISGDQIRAIDRMKDRTGFYILMGSAADAVSYETTQYGQGLLTYALLQGMKGAALREGEFADIGRLFEYAVDNVPQLARNIGGIQRPFIAAPRGSSFDVARFTDAEKKLVPLAIIKPLILRPNFLNDEEKVDDLELSTAVRKQLNEESLVVSRESEPGLVYVDGDELPGAIRPSGTYLIKGQRVTVTVVLRRDKEKVATLTVEGDREKMAELSKKLVQAIAKAASRAFQ